MQRKFCIAPMMGWTDRHQRFLARQFSKHLVLFNEMRSSEAILMGPRETYLELHPSEHPVAFQLGGNDPKKLADAARAAEAAGFDEINFNVGCPSPSGSRSCYGAYLMRHPELVRDCLAAMAEAVEIPVSIKTRVGVDREDSYELLHNFIECVLPSGCNLFYLHARKAWLDGLNTRENRSIPPLRYEFVYRVKRDFPHLQVIINGAITNWNDIHAHLEQVDGVMVGRHAYHQPAWLGQVDAQLFGEPASQPTLISAVLEQLQGYVERELSRGTPLGHMARHWMGLFHGRPGTRKFREHVASHCLPNGAGIKEFLGVLELAKKIESDFANSELGGRNEVVCQDLVGSNGAAGRLGQAG
jgi:tRNA-dihydrouridine synthase A